MLSLIFPISGCNSIPEIRSIQKTSKNAAESFLTPQENNKLMDRIAVLPIKNDPRGCMQFAINEQILVRKNATGWTAHVPRESTKLALLMENLRSSLKANRNYDTKTMVELGRFIDYRYAVTGEVLDMKTKIHDVRIIFRGVTLDLEEARIIHAATIEGIFHPPFSILEKFLIIVLTIIYFYGLFLISRGNQFFLYPVRRGVLVAGGICIYILLLLNMGILKEIIR